MSQSAGVWLVLVVALVAANLPFVSERLFIVGPRRVSKALGWRLLELALLGAATVGLGFLIESRLGQRSPQGWEFYAALTFMFLTFASPGFVWRYLRRRR
ncbi:MAG TPA: DUF2818 family protein [Burkholderiaceae bacterium]|nr:DUF2818 family protein [Burkholderiaceae bacterium]